MTPDTIRSMWNRPANWSCLLATVLAPATASVAADGDLVASTNKNRISIGPRFGLNVTAKFTGSGSVPARGAIGTPAGGQNHAYDDGYVRIDSSGNAGGQTWNWGYRNASQVDAANNAIAMHSSTGEGDAVSKPVEDDPHYGLEVLYSRELGRLGRGRWGIEAALGYNAINLTDRGTLSASVRRVTDAYTYVPGTTPPAAPFEGTAEGPNFVINDSPTRASETIPGGATVTGEREFEADLFGLRLGPFVEWPIARKLSLYFSGGLAVAGVSSDFRWNESVSIDGVGSFASRGSDSHHDVLFGGYVGATLYYSVTERLSVYAGAQFQTLGNYTHSAGQRKAKLDLTDSFFVSAGLGYSF